MVVLQRREELECLGTVPQHDATRAGLVETDFRHDGVGCQLQQLLLGTGAIGLGPGAGPARLGKTWEGRFRLWS